MKKIMATLATGLIMAAAPATAAPAPLAITGDTTVKYQKTTAAGEQSVSGAVYTIKLRGEAELGHGWSVYTRLAAQNVTNSALADFNTAPLVYGENKNWVVALDQFGVNYKTDKLTYKLGRQAVTVGTTSLLYSRSESNIGKNAFVDGLSVAGTIGAVDIAAVAAKEDNPAGEQQNKVYALRAGHSPTEQFNYGVTLGRYSSDASTNHWAVDGTYKFGKSYITAEYAKASSSVNNTAYAVSLGYDFDNRTSMAITNFRVEEFGSMGQQSDFDYGNRGFHYSLSHKLSEQTMVDLVYKDQKTISEGKNNQSWEATLSYGF